MTEEGTQDMTVADKIEALADEIEQAISDSLDLDWQPSWAVPAIIEIFKREAEASMLVNDDAYERGYADAKKETLRRAIWFLAGAIFGSIARLLGQMI